MMNELKFIMITKLIEKYEYKISDFFSIIEEYVKEKHDAEFMGIKHIEYGGITYTWEKTTGCRGVYNTTSGTKFTSFDSILTFLQKENNNEL